MFNWEDKKKVARQQSNETAKRAIEVERTRRMSVAADEVAAAAAAAAADRAQNVATAQRLAEGERSRRIEQERVRKADAESKAAKADAESKAAELVTSKEGTLNIFSHFIPVFEPVLLLHD